MRERIRLRQYAMTIHADEEMDDDGLTIYDVENAILTGEIIERQKDRGTNEAKFLVRGETIDGASVLTAATKFGFRGQADYHYGLCRIRLKIKFASRAARTRRKPNTLRAVTAKARIF